MSIYTIIGGPGNTTVGGATRHVTPSFKCTNQITHARNACKQTHTHTHLLTSEASAAALSAALACLAATSAVLAAISAALATLSAALPAAADASADIIPNATFNNTFGDVTCGTTGTSTSPHLLLPALLATPGTRSPATREEEQEEEEGVGPDSATFPPGALSRS